MTNIELVLTHLDVILKMFANKDKLKRERERKKDSEFQHYASLLKDMKMKNTRETKINFGRQYDAHSILSQTHLHGEHATVCRFVKKILHVLFLM